MASALNNDKKIAIVSALSEGFSIRSAERMTGVHRDTIMRLAVRVAIMQELKELRANAEPEAEAS